MQIPRFFLTELSLDYESGKQLTIADPAIVAQVRNVLRMRPDDTIILLDGRGNLYQCRLDSISKADLKCTVISRDTAGGDKQFSVRAGVALIKGDRFEWALQKMTELGVDSVVPLITERTVVKPPADAKGVNTKLARWQSIVKEAAEQSERATIPHIVAAKKLNDFIDDATAGGAEQLVFICAERSSGAPLRDIFLDHACKRTDLLATKGKTINLIVGPEGGFSPVELEYAQKRGAVPVSLGQRILRAETAAVYAVAQVIWCLEK